MNTSKSLFIATLMVYCTCLSALCFGSNMMVGDTIDCLVDFELEQSETGNFIVSMIPDTTWNFPNNIVSTVQVTVKAPTGQFAISEITNLLENVVFFIISRDTMPEEAPDFDYISIALGSQGTAGIPFQRGEKVNLFSFQNERTCGTGTISLMDNYTDPFFPPNTRNANVGQQLTVAGFNLADVPIGVRGEGILCLANGDTSTLGVQIVKQDIRCTGGNDGIIIAKGNGGTSPYNYLWNTGSTSSTIDNLIAGDYTLTLTDAVGDTIVRQLSIMMPDSLILRINKSNPLS